MFWLRSHSRWITAILVAFPCLLGSLAQQPPPDRKQGDATQTAPHKKNGESQGSYRAWVEEVHWIITAEERAAFEKLPTDEERDQFVEQFWGRRDPTPETVENEYKEEHYRRVAYSNVHFAAIGRPGWKSDRGRAYIVLGPPDKIDHPPTAPAGKSRAQSGNALPAPPEEVWRYLYRKPSSTPHDQAWFEGRLSQAGAVVTLRFVDTCRCGDYRLVLDPSQKDPFQ